MKIYIDADACPVVDSVIFEAENNDIPVVMVKSFSHFSPHNDPSNVEVIYVDKGADMADFRIMKLVKRNDIVITQDYGLASLCLGKGCHVLHHKGFAYTDNNIDTLLHSRYSSAMARKSGQKTKGPKAFTDEERNKFSQLLKLTIDQIKK